MQVFLSPKLLNPSEYKRSRIIRLYSHGSVITTKDHTGPRSPSLSMHKAKTGVKIHNDGKVVQAEFCVSRKGKSDEGEIFMVKCP